MRYDPDFDDDSSGKTIRKAPRTRPLAAFGVLASLVVVIAGSFLSVELLVPTPPHSLEAATLASSDGVLIRNLDKPAESLPYHLIVNRATGQCLDVPYGSSESRTRVEQFPVNGGTNQLWLIEPVPGDGVRIVNRQSGQCLDMPFGTSEPHSAVEQFPINGGSNQGWRLEPVGDQWYRIVNQHTNQCLEVPAGSFERRIVIEQASQSESTSQHWRPIAVR